METTVSNVNDNLENLIKSNDISIFSGDVLNGWKL